MQNYQGNKTKKYSRVETNRYRADKEITWGFRCRHTVHNIPVPQSKKSFIVHVVSGRNDLLPLYASRYGGSVMDLKPVLRIHEILVRIRLRGSITLTNGSGPGCRSGSCYFRQWLQVFNKKLLFFLTFFAFFPGGQKHVDPTDPNPDPQHYLKQIQL